MNVFIIKKRIQTWQSINYSEAAHIVHQYSVYVFLLLCSQHLLSLTPSGQLLMHMNDRGSVSKKLLRRKQKNCVLKCVNIGYNLALILKSKMSIYKLLGPLTASSFDFITEWALLLSHDLTVEITLLLDT